jgi:hypothetical protein
MYQEREAERGTVGEEIMRSKPQKKGKEQEKPKNNRQEFLRI